MQIAKVKHHRSRGTRVPSKHRIAAIAASTIGAGLAITSKALAAPITWSTPVPIASDSDVDTTGSLVYAYRFGNGVGSATLNTGFTFTGFSPSVQSATVQTSSDTNITLATPGGTLTYYNDSNRTTASTISSAYATVLADWAYSSGSDMTVALNNLTPNQTYEVQFWVTDVRNLGRSETISGGGNTSGTVSFDYSNTPGGAGEYVIGDFTADASGAETLTVVGGTPQIDALQVRSIPVPEPASCGAVIAGLSGILLKRRRRALA